MTAAGANAILFIASTLRRTGPTNQLYNLIKYIDTERFVRGVVTLSVEPDDSRSEDFLGLGANIESLRLTRVAGVVLAKRRLLKIVKRMNPQLIHSQGIRADVLSSLLDVDVPKIATIRNFPQLDYRMTYGPLLGRIMAARHRAAMAKLTLCIGVSQAVTDNLRQHLHLENVHTICNGVDTGLYSPALPDERQKQRHKLGLPLESRIWVATGHMTARKKPIFLIEAFREFNRMRPNHVLLLVGGGDLEQDCTEAAAGLANVHCVGRVRNVVDYLRASDYFVSASKAEGLPNAVLEAMACGLPVLLSDIAPHKEIFDANDQIGATFVVGSERALIRGFASVSDADYSSMSQAALDTAIGRFSALEMSRQYQDLYTEMTVKTNASA